MREHVNPITKTRFRIWKYPDPWRPLIISLGNTKKTLSKPRETWYIFYQWLPKRYMTYFFFSNLWLTRMADPKAPRPTCSMISYCSILDSIDSPKFNPQTSLFSTDGREWGDAREPKNASPWFFSQCHHCKPNPWEFWLPHFVEKFRNFDDNYLQTTDEVMAVPTSTPLTSLSIMWVAPTKLIVVSYCCCLTSHGMKICFITAPAVVWGLKAPIHI